MRLVIKTTGSYTDTIYTNEKGVKHREEGPALQNIWERKEWYLNGLRHREDGPAIERPDGSKEWYLHGKQVDPFK